MSQVCPGWHGAVAGVTGNAECLGRAEDDRGQAVGGGWSVCLLGRVLVYLLDVGRREEVVARPQLGGVGGRLWRGRRCRRGVADTA